MNLGKKKKIMKAKQVEKKRRHQEELKFGVKEDRSERRKGR